MYVHTEHNDNILVAQISKAPFAYRTGPNVKDLLCHETLTAAGLSLHLDDPVHVFTECWSFFK